MLFSYDWLQSFFQKKLPKPEKLAELLTMHSFEVSEVSKEGKDWILDIDILPNRMPDCASHIGVARECAALTNSKFKIQNSKFKIQNSKFKIQNFLQLEVQDKNDCPRYMAKMITDVKVGPSPKWMQKRLEVCGLRPINNVVDVANYVMLETGQPLHAFDYQKISNLKPPKKSQISNLKPQKKSQISNLKSQNSKLKIQNFKKLIVRRAKKGEEIITLDGDKYYLDEDILIIADSHEPLAIAGIKGGKKAEIDNTTKTIVLESANFNPSIIRRGSQKLNLRTDASLRFEHGLDPNLTEFAINRAAALIANLAGGKVVQGLSDFYPRRVLPNKIKLELDFVRRFLGVNIADKEIKNILERLGFKVENWKTKVINVIVPTWRLDISLPEDLVEEIGRIYGYEKISPSFPLSVLVPPKTNYDIFWEQKTKDILKELKLTEVYTYSFISEKMANALKYSPRELFELENPVSQNYRYLRPSLIPNLLLALQKNQYNFSDIKIFELGKIFEKPWGEKRMLTGLISGNSFYLAKGIVDKLLQSLGLSDIWYDEYQPSPEDSPKSIWQANMSAEVKSGDVELGFVGKISNKILQELDIEASAVVFDLDFEKVQQLALEETIYHPVSKYPAVVRDIAVLVPRGTKAVEVLNVINRAGGKLVRDVDLFDMYEGEELPEGKKNLAFHIIYQAEDHTLTSQEVNQLQDKIIKALEENLEWEVRK